jgi:hypothetical protein
MSGVMARATTDEKTLARVRVFPTDAVVAESELIRDDLATSPP